MNDLINELETIRAEMAELDNVETVDEALDDHYANLAWRERQIEDEIKQLRAPRGKVDANTMELIRNNMD